MTSLEDLIARVGYSDEVHLLLVNAYPITTFIGNERRNRYIHKSSHRQSRRQTKSRASLPYRLDQRTRASHRSCMRYSSHLLLSQMLQDPLEVVPLLLPRTENAAHDILCLVGECSNAKEVIVTTQASIERLGSTGLGDDEELEEHSTPLSQLITLVSLYASCEP